MSGSSVCTREVSGQLEDLHAEIAEKVSKTSYKNEKWHTDGDPSAISFKISQTQYICLKL